LQHIPNVDDLSPWRLLLRGSMAAKLDHFFPGLTGATRVWKNLISAAVTTISAIRASPCRPLRILHSCLRRLSVRRPGPGLPIFPS
jgi:hypothetical protein